MSSDALFVAVCLIPLLVNLMVDKHREVKRHIKELDQLAAEHRTERTGWHAERQKLLDRIQAGSFAELKQQEVRVIKAQSGEREAPKLDPM